MYKKHTKNLNTKKEKKTSHKKQEKDKKKKEIFQENVTRQSKLRKSNERFVISKNGQSAKLFVSHDGFWKKLKCFHSVVEFGRFRIIKYIELKSLPLNLKIGGGGNVRYIKSRIFSIQLKEISTECVMYFRGFRFSTNEHLHFYLGEFGERLTNFLQFFKY